MTEPAKDPKRDALDAVADLLKVLTSLASGVIVFSVAIVGASATPDYSPVLKWILIIALAGLVASVALGLFAQGYIPKQINNGKCDINEPSFRGISFLAMLAFGLGITLLATVLGLSALNPSLTGKVQPNVADAATAISLAQRECSVRNGLLRSVVLIKGVEDATDLRNDQWRITFDVPGKGSAAKSFDVLVSARTGQTVVVRSSAQSNKGE